MLKDLDKLSWTAIFARWDADGAADFVVEGDEGGPCVERDWENREVEEGQPGSEPLRDADSFGNNSQKSKGNSNSNGQSRSRFPTGMTDRKATATATTTATARATATATAVTTAKVDADSLRE